MHDRLDSVHGYIEACARDLDHAEHLWIEPGDSPESHRDSFDWLLPSTARRLKLPLLSKDPEFEK